MMSHVHYSRSRSHMEPHLRNVLNSIQTASPYDICVAFSQIDQKSSKPDIISKMLVRCIAIYRKQVSKPFEGLSSLSKPAEEIYYQFRQASTFQQIVDAFGLVNPQGPDPELAALIVRLNRDEERANVDKTVEARATRKELCSIQEHFEGMLSQIFAAEEPSAEVVNELRSMLADVSIQASNSLMTAVYDAVRKQITPANIANLVLWTLELMRPGEVPPITTERALAILGGGARAIQAVPSPRVVPASPANVELM